MTPFEFLDRRPIVVAVGGPNGAGKSTFYRSHLVHTGLRFVNADILADELGLDAAGAMRTADAMGRALVGRGESFAFETVFSDPVGDKLAFLVDTAARGYTVVLCFIGLAGFPRTLANLHAAIRRLPHVLVFDNSDLARPFRLAAVFDRARCVEGAEPTPDWLQL